MKRIIKSAPGGNRTPNLSVRSALLCPFELLGHQRDYSIQTWKRQGVIRESVMVPEFPHIQIQYAWDKFRNMKPTPLLLRHHFSNC